MTKTSEYRVSIKGPGVTVDREVAEGVARHLISLLLVAHGANGGSFQDSIEGVTTDKERASGQISPEQFMSTKRPATDMERVTSLAYYLDKFRQIGEVKTREVTEINREARQPRLSNISYALRNAASAGYLSQVGGGRKQITSLGKELVDALPDREKVKHVLEQRKAMKRKKRRGKGRRDGKTRNQK